MVDRHETPLLRLPGPWGVPIDITPSFMLLIALIVVGSPASVADSLIVAGLFTLAILLHEVGHTAGCMVQGVKVHKLVLWGGGGYCSHRIVRNAEAIEFILALGPLTSLALWALAGLAVPALSGDGAAWLAMFAQINLAVFALNMIPVQPLDGGRLLHLALRRRLVPGRAAQVTGAIGLVCTAFWIPALLLVFVNIGVLLLFLPSLVVHWRMLHDQAA